jgi:hypothetical protein
VIDAGENRELSIGERRQESVNRFARRKSALHWHEAIVGIDELLLKERPSSDAVAGAMGCCACTPNGHAVAAPPRSVTNSPRLMPHPRLKPMHRTASNEPIECRSATMSALAQKADIPTADFDVCFTPQKRTLIDNSGMPAMGQQRTLEFSR